MIDPDIDYCLNKCPFQNNADCSPCCDRFKTTGMYSLSESKRSKARRMFNANVPVEDAAEFCNLHLPTAKRWYAKFAKEATE